MGVAQTCFDFTGPLLISNIIKYIEQGQSDKFQGIILVLAFIFARIAIIIVSTQYSIVNVKKYYENIEVDWE